jgi:hypothetical protein
MVIPGKWKPKRMMTGMIIKTLTCDMILGIVNQGTGDPIRKLRGLIV